MKVIVVDEKKEKNKKKIQYRLNSLLEWSIYIFCYALILWVASNVFHLIYIENFWSGLLASIIIYILNKTLKPILVTISLPIIGISLGLFYVVINIVILILTALILGKYFNLVGPFHTIFASIFISFVSMMVDGFIIKPIIERCSR